MDYRRRPFRVQYKRVAAYTLLAAILVWLMLSKLLPNRLSVSLLFKSTVLELITQYRSPANTLT